MFKQALLASSFIAVVALVLSPAGSHAAAPTPADVVKTLDADSDGTIDLAEAQKAAGTKFDALDADHDGTIDKKEAAVAHITGGQLAKADSDKDATLDKTEYLALVQARFTKADTDHDGTLTAAELATPAGKALTALLQ